MEDDYTSESSLEAGYWMETYLCEKGNDFFCEVDEEYIMDRFNLTGLQAQVSNFALAYECIIDNVEERHVAQMSSAQRREMEAEARHLYGLIHARFILTSRGLTKMADRFRSASFGRCPRVLCEGQPVLPVGLADTPGTDTLRLYCPRCEDVYNPPGRRHAAQDGAYWGRTLPHLLLQVFPTLCPRRADERYLPRIFGFRVHSIAEEHRQQDAVRRELESRQAALTKIVHGT